MLFNLLYTLAFLVLAPWLVWRSCRTGRYRRGLRAKLLGVGTIPLPQLPRVWFHGVSVGEVHLLRGLIKAFRERHPDWALVISATTDTGLAEARKHFAALPNCVVIPYPFDFTWAVRRTLRSVQPQGIVLAESELWPNFLHEAQRAGVPVVLVNGRMSPRTAKRYQRVAGFAKRVFFGRVAQFAMQSDTYATHLRDLGIPAERIHVTGNVKYDGAGGDPANPQTAALRTLFGLAASDLVWVAGSTHAPEEEIVLRIYQRLLTRFPTLRLIVVPRAPERFQEVATRIQTMGLPLLRHSEIGRAANLPERPVVLIDSMGVLGAAWGLAHVGFTGGSLNEHRGGQSMIEPAGYGVPVLFGPHTWNFKDAVAGLLEHGGASQIRDEATLEQELIQLLESPDRRSTMGQAGRAFVQAQQGATQRTLDLLDTTFAQGSTS